jgi:hypothetical protein
MHIVTQIRAWLPLDSRDIPRRQETLGYQALDSRQGISSRE